VTTKAEESPLLKFVTRKRLVKQTEKTSRLVTFSVEISDSVVPVVASGVYKWSINPFSNP
jgi:hypothetical protein